MRPVHIHRQPADQVGVVLFHALAVGDQGDGEKADTPCEDQAVNEDDEGRLLEVRQLGRFHFAVDLGQRLFAAHRQDGMAESNEQADETDQAKPVFGVQVAQLLGQGSFTQEAGRIYFRCRDGIVRRVVDLGPQINFT